LGSLPGSLGPGDVDLFRALGRVGQDDHLVIAHFAKASTHSQYLLAVATPHDQLPRLERDKHGRMPGKHSDLAARNRDQDALCPPIVYGPIASHHHH
jgi:hypothetical protein